MYIALCSRDDCVDYHINIALSCVHTCSLHIHTICLTFLLYITTTLLCSPEFTCASMWKSMWNSCPCCCFTSFWRSCMYAYIYICPHLPTVYYHKWMNLLFSISYTCIFSYVYLLPTANYHMWMNFLISISYMCIFAHVYLLPTANCHTWMNLLISISHICIFAPVYLLPTVTCGWAYRFLFHK